MNSREVRDCLYHGGVGIINATHRSVFGQTLCYLDGHELFIAIQAGLIERPTVRKLGVWMLRVEVRNSRIALVMRMPVATTTQIQGVIQRNFIPKIKSYPW